MSAQDEKISLLEQQLQQWQFCVGAAIPGNQQVVAVASQPHTPPKPPPSLPQQQPQPAWLRWLGGDKPAASTNNNNNAASEERPPPWSKWLPGGVGGGGGGNSTASGTPASTAPPTPEPRQQQQRGPSPLPHSRKENGEAAPAMGMVARSPLAPAAPNTPTQSSHQPQPHSQQPLVPGTPQVADWAGACTAAQRLQEQLSTAGGGTPTQQTTENFLESFLTAVTPQQPTPAREQPPRSGNHRSQRKATPPRRPPTPPPQQQQTTTVEVEIDLSDPSATRALLDGSSNADAPSEDTVEPSEIAARRGSRSSPASSTSARRRRTFWMASRRRSRHGRPPQRPLAPRRVGGAGRRPARRRRPPCLRVPWCRREGCGFKLERNRPIKGQVLPNNLPTE